MIDNEIKKVLGCCTTNGASCKDCPAFVKVDRSNCKKYFRGALDLINRLEAENDDLKRDAIPKLQDGLNRANKYGAEMDKENQQLKADVERLKYLLEREENKNDIFAKQFYKHGVNEFAERLEKEFSETEIKLPKSKIVKQTAQIFFNILTFVKREMVGE